MTALNSSTESQTQTWAASLLMDMSTSNNSNNNAPASHSNSGNSNNGSHLVPCNFVPFRTGHIQSEAFGVMHECILLNQSEFEEESASLVQEMRVFDVELEQLNAAMASLPNLESIEKAQIELMHQLQEKSKQKIAFNSQYATLAAQAAKDLTAASQPQSNQPSLVGEVALEVASVCVSVENVTSQLIKDMAKLKSQREKLDQDMVEMEKKLKDLNEQNVKARALYAKAAELETRKKSLAVRKMRIVESAKKADNLNQFLPFVQGITPESGILRLSLDRMVTTHNDLGSSSSGLQVNQSQQSQQSNIVFNNMQKSSMELPAAVSLPLSSSNNPLNPFQKLSEFGSNQQNNIPGESLCTAYKVILERINILKAKYEVLEDKIVQWNDKFKKRNNNAQRDVAATLNSQLQLAQKKNAKDEIDSRIKAVENQDKMETEKETNTQKMDETENQVQGNLSILSAEKAKLEQECQECQTAVSLKNADATKSAMKLAKLIGQSEEMSKHQKEMALLAEEIKLLQPNLHMYKQIKPSVIYLGSLQPFPMSYPSNSNSNNGVMTNSSREQETKQEKSKKRSKVAIRGTIRANSLRAGIVFIERMTELQNKQQRNVAEAAKEVVDLSTLLNFYKVIPSTATISYSFDPILSQSNSQSNSNSNETQLSSHKLMEDDVELNLSSSSSNNSNSNSNGTQQPYALRSSSSNSNTMAQNSQSQSSSSKRKVDEVNEKNSRKRQKVKNTIAMDEPPELPENFPDDSLHAKLLDWTQSPETIRKTIRKFTRMVDGVLNNPHNGWTPLPTIIMNGPLSYVKVLLEFKHNLRVVTAEGWGILQLIALSFEMNNEGVEDILTQIMDSKLFSLNTTSELMPLHIAVNYGRNHTVKALLNLKADVNALDADGRAPIHYAACKDSNLDVLKILLESSGIEPNKLSKIKSNALHFAAEFCAFEIAKVLIEKNCCDKNAKDCNGWTPLDYALKPTVEIDDTQRKLLVDYMRLNKCVANINSESMQT